MNKLLKPKNLPLFAVEAGILGWLLSRQLYRWGMDDKGLLMANHPISWLLWIVTTAALGILAANVWKLDGSDRYEDNFAPSHWAALGHTAAGLCFLLTALLNAPMMPGKLGIAWKVLGLLSGPCLLLAGLFRLRGKRPFFGLHMVPCLFLVFHIISHYQTWSGNPQVQDYVFSLLGAMALVFFAYYSAAFDVDSGNRRMHLGMGLGAVCLCITAIATTEYLFLYTGGLIWAESDLCSLTPKPRAPESQEGEVNDDPA